MRKELAALIVFIFGYASPIFSQPPVTANQGTGYKTLDYMIEMKAASKTLTGQQGRKDWKKMRTVTGNYPALWGEDFLYCISCKDTDPMTTLADWRALITHDAKQAWKKGAIISLMFHACPPTGVEPCWWDGAGNVKASLSSSEWTELITDGTTLNNKWKARLDVLVPYLQELKEAGVEVLFRPYHEMNQSAFWWGGRTGTNGTAKLFQLTRDYLKNTKGLTNLIWVWDLQDLTGFGTTTLNNYDPGNNYWDVLALDFYGSTNVSTLYSSTKYSALKTKAAGKPIAIGECTYLPTTSILNSQPDWAFFMGWKEGDGAGIFEKNSNTTINSLYKSSNAITIAPGAQTDTICDFDDVYPFIRKSGSVTISPVVNASGSSASGKMGVLQVPSGSTGDRIITLWLDDLFDYEPIDPRDYVGISFDAQITGASGSYVGFGLKLEQSTVSNSIAQIQDMGHVSYNYFNRYSNSGADAATWQEVHILFERPDNVGGGTGGILSQIQSKIGTSGYDPTKYDRIVIWVAPYQGQSTAFTLNIDNIRLRRDWNVPTQISQPEVDAIQLFASNGIIHATAENGQTVALKVYALSGQEIAKGINQVNIGAKGIYIVKATLPEGATVINKIVIR